MSESDKKYEFTKEDFHFETSWSRDESSKFDQALMQKWMFMQENHEYFGFKYKLKIEHSKVIVGKYKFLAQLNKDRALLRRKPEAMQSMNQEFNSNSFNFTHLLENEILFEVINKEKEESGNFVVINNSPLESSHCLLLPKLHSCLPQVLTTDSLLAALQLFLLSKSQSLRMGFNGLCAHASVNHLHFHLYYLRHQMLLETIEVEHLAGPCYTLVDFPSRGFAFQLSSGQDLQEFVRNVCKLVTYLQENEKPHNIVLTRGSSFQDKTPSLDRHHVRLYVWARKPAFGAKNASAEDAVERMSPALCELFGQILVKTNEDYDNMTEDFVSAVLSDITVEPFNSVVDQVRKLFQESQ